jgi:hypothetical protein
MFLLFDEKRSESKSAYKRIIELFGKNESPVKRALTIKASYFLALSSVNLKATL